MNASSGARLLAASLACSLALKYSLGETPLREIPASGSMDFMIFMIAPPLAVKMLASHSGLDALSDNASGLCCSISDADRATQGPTVSPAVVVKRRRAYNELNGELDRTERSRATSPGLPVLKVSEVSDLPKRTAG
jgi:hypothetical protein